MDDDKPAPRTATRRRGADLQDAIFDAVEAELLEVGYAGFRMESVAARARTSKPVLYRRWSGRAPLIVDAVSRRIRRAENIPDTGSLRGDVLELLRWMVGNISHFGADVMWGLMSDVAREAGLKSLVQSTIIKTVRTEVMSPILDRAVARGEADRDRLAPRVVSLPVDLARNEFLVWGEVSDEAIVEIVDDVFLPVVRSRR